MQTILIAAITLDGKIAKHALHNVDWTSSADKRFFKEQTEKAGVVIVGSHTYQALPKPLKNRLTLVMTRSPHLYKEREVPNVLEFKNTAPRGILKELSERGFKRAVIGGGAEIYALFLREKLVDELYFTIAPKIFGRGVSIFGNDVELNAETLKLTEVKRLGDDEVLVKYKVL
ncbi:MAG: hypothetical protein A2249_01540 [Candidatus Jacksonbacteria bacterium RIFOXYA2_FULL_44_7]|uniref:DHFR domain-containing protein n=1 Tax=Candidatus Jacksonbacteria bacterium RIFCSPLOWO2_02_FULL_44_20 TaxID=1798460 RepID=A0A1G2AAT8_9BACT|nr:MAG: FolA: dihydrofolate reductase [Parcubacteria group bacterium GW2011_GWC2_44_17]KKT48939.1 MAG: FolA: dihydrofolate reductase [Parcubacteria group bacterium GW2011_GWF2_44_17]OGY71759.1 MAG: hypothetical protein A3C00_03775 [Candidatus Jacksonbacteria bacterium RIFCSPHIGHO2_02_FULL_44_25]OGY72344.1 MAG: hypothetical protein A3E05_02070 [Candidatus Jacksonbacteria bacterium RIFCSPHIGHO2_12_FULL_44_12]OGY73942.1 MAG: hypothetical protein A3H61_02040 [Candidatus Jacksonbacteria bacterium RI